MAWHSSKAGQWQTSFLPACVGDRACLSVLWARALEYVLIASERQIVDTLKLLPQGDAGNVLCAIVPPRPTYNIVGDQVTILSAGRRVGFSMAAGPVVMASVQSVKSPRKSRATKGNDELGKLRA